MTEKIEYEINVKGDIEDVKKYDHAVVRGHKDVFFHRSKSKKGGDSFDVMFSKLVDLFRFSDVEKAKRGVFPIACFLFGHDNMAVMVLGDYYKTNGVRGLDPDFVMDYLKSKKFTDFEIISLFLEAKKKAGVLDLEKYHDDLKKQILEESEDVKEERK